jgi:thioredoxin reductase
MNLTHTNDYDVVVIGGAAAGLSAALVLTRARRTVAVVDAGAPRNAPAAHMQGFLSRDGLPPQEFLAAGRSEVAGYGGVIIDSNATGIEPREGTTFTVRLADGQQLTARRVLVATGLRDELPDIPGLSERWGRDVLHCPYCHGYEVRDRQVGVLGTADDTVAFAQLVRQWAADVVYFPHTRALTADEREQLTARAIGIVEGNVTRLHISDDHLRGVQMDDGRLIHRGAVFVRPRFVPNNDLLVALGCALDEAGWVVADAVGATSVPGVWVAGNVSNARAQVITAAGEGSATAIALNADLVLEDVDRAVLDLRSAVST